MFKIKNIKQNSNIIVNGKNLIYEDTMKIDKDTLESISSLIENKYLSVEPIIVNRVSENDLIKILSVDELSLIKENVKSMIEIFYKFHVNVPIEEEELKKIVWFYKNVSPISTLPSSIKDELDYVEDQEQLIEILINQIYPILLENFYKK